MNYTEDSLAVAVVVGLVEVFKQLGLPSKFAPLLALFWGIVYSTGALVIGGQPETVSAIYKGVLIGLTAAGLYSGVKATIKNPV